MVCNIQNSSCFSSVCAARTCACYVLQGAGHAERWGKKHTAAQRGGAKSYASCLSTGWEPHKKVLQVKVPSHHI